LIERRTLVAIALLTVGFLLAAGYPYLLYFTSEKTSIEVIKITLSLVFIILGAIAGATGLILLRGVKREE